MGVSGAKTVGFDASKLKKQLFDAAVEEQTKRLIAYAEEEINRLGEMIQTYNLSNHMDRTGNLLNSLCWGVAYNNELKGSGFYRNANSMKISHLHEWSPEYAAYPVDGHREAEMYLRRYGRLGSGGGTWRVFFAILAPYWGYWEEGFTMKGKEGRSFKIAGLHVMSQFYDKVSKDLKPAKMKIKIHVEEYSKTKMQKDYKRRVNNPYSYFNKRTANDKRYRKS